MNQSKYIRKREKGKHLTLVERGKIEAFLKMNKTKKWIANELGVSERTIYREIKRGTVKGLLNSDLTTRDEYSAEYSNKRYIKNQKNKQGSLKIGKNIQLSQYIENKIIKEKFSPYATLEEAKRNGYSVNFSLKTLYNYINSNIFLNLKKKHLPYNKTQSKTIKYKRIRKIGGRSIEERDLCIEKRNEPIHWEMDTVLGKRGSKGCLLVLTERCSRKEIIYKLRNKTSAEVVNAMKNIFKRYPGTANKRFVTITTDNGSEFMNAQALEDMGIQVFYAHSYCSGERGSNENNNKLIRRYIPKGVDIAKYTNKEIKEIERWMNNYPRKIFNGKTSEEIYRKQIRKFL